MKSRINLISLTFAIVLSLCSYASHASQATTATCPPPYVFTFENAGLCAAYQWNVGPQNDGENSMTLQFVDAQTLTPKDPTAPVKLALFMPDMGHGSRPTLITPNGTGAVTVSKIFFIMKGGWEVRINVGDEQQVLPVTIQ